MLRNRWLLLWGCGLALCLGCGGDQAAKTVRVSGIVTYRGKPLPEVNVAFISRSGAPATGVTDAEGRFELTTFDQPGAVVGLHQVTITPQEGESEMPLPGQPPARPKSPIPGKYATAETSDLTAEVKAGEENEFRFELAD